MRLTHLALAVPLVAASPFDTNIHTVPRNAGVSYDGYHVYSVASSDVHQASDLVERFSHYHTHPIRDALSVAVPPSDVAAFESLGLNARLVNADLGAHIRSIDSAPTSYDRTLHKRGELPSLSWFDSYHPYADHLDYWDDLVNAFPENLEKFSIGKSYENRTIYAFHVFGNEEKGGYQIGSKEKSQKPVILWHATVHAREVSLVEERIPCHVNTDGYGSGSLLW